MKMDTKFNRTHTRLVSFGVLAAVALLAGFGASPALAQSIVVNGEFTAGNSGFTSDYTYSTSLSTGGSGGGGESKYCVSTNPHLHHPAFFTMGDHTTGSGLMMVINGAADITQTVWEGTTNVDLVVGQSYDFSAWVAQVCGGAIASLTFKADGVVIGTLSPAVSGWTRLFGTFTALNARPVLTMTNSQPAVEGNDFALDDVSIFYEGTTDPPTGDPTTTALVSSPDPSYVGQLVTLTATVSPSAATGTVTFKEGATTLGTGTVIGGVATMTTTAFGAGLHNLTAEYGGDADYAPSSGADDHTVLNLPEIDVQRPAGTSIPDGGTDNLGRQPFGTVNVTYTIANVTGAPLNVTGATASNYVNSSGFTVVTAMPLTINAGNTATMQISFNTLGYGAFSFDMDIANNDADENPYDIHVMGTVDPEIDVQRPAGTSIADGGTDNVGNRPVGCCGPDLTLTYTIDNTAGTFALNVIGVTASNYVNSDEFIVMTTLPMSVAAGGTATLEVKFCVNATGPFSFDIDIANNDLNENPYDIQVAGTGVVSYDFGDAPDPVEATAGKYPTLLANDGARHQISSRLTNVKLGTLLDNDTDGQPTADADGDDTDCTDDEDGVTVTGLTFYQGVTKNVTFSVTNNTGSQAYLNAFIDWNQDGDWTDADEQVATNKAVSAGNNTLSVTPPMYPSFGTSFARFRVSTQQNLLSTGLASDGEVEDYPVTIKPVTMEVIKPNGYETYRARGFIKVQWSSDPRGLSTVTLRYSTDDGATYPYLIVARTPNNDCYEWLAPVLHTTHVSVRAEVDGWPMAFDMSNGSFSIDSIPPVVDLLTPNGGESWAAGTTHTITWTATDNFGFGQACICLRYSTDGGITYPFLISWENVNDGSYDWKVPVGLNSDDVRVKIKAIDAGGNDAEDYSGTSFFVHSLPLLMVSPNGGEVWDAADAQTISWAANEQLGSASNSVTVKYSTNGGATYPNVLYTSVASNSNYVWTTPSNLFSNAMKIRVEIQNGNNLLGYDESDANFRLVNPPPSVRTIPDMTFQNDGSLYFCLNPYVTDKNDGIETLTWSHWVSNSSVQVGVNQDNKYCSIAAPEFSGVVSVILTATDPHGATDSDTMVVTIMNSPTDVSEASDAVIPTEFSLSQNYPNPFNPQTTIRFEMPKPSEVVITVYNMNGKKVADLFMGRKEAGIHTVTWEAQDNPSGTYIVRFQAGSLVQMRKCVLLK